MKTIEQILEAGKVLAVLSLTNGEVIPFYEGETTDDIYTVLTEQITNDIKEGKETTTILVNGEEREIDLETVFNVRNFITGAVTSIEEMEGILFSPKTFKQKNEQEIYNAIKLLNEWIGADVDKGNEETMTLVKLQRDAISNLPRFMDVED